MSNIILPYNANECATTTKEIAIQPASHYQPINRLTPEQAKNILLDKTAPIHPMRERWAEAYVAKRAKALPKDKEHSFYALPVADQNAVKAQLDKWGKDKEKETKEAEIAAQKKTVKSKAKGLGNAPFKMLGYDQGSYFFWSAETMQVTQMSGKDLLSKNLTMLAPLSFWSDNYPSFNAYGEQSIEGEWLTAGDEIMRAQARIGVYETGTVRGRGFWREGERIIHHNGDEVRCVQTGKTIPLLSNDLEFLYQRTASKPSSSDEATQGEIDKLNKAIDSIYWENPITCGVLFLGWLVAAPFCGMLPWRSHLWVTAPRGAGKSDTVCRIASSVLTNALYVKGDTSEAGIRQELRSNATPLIGDEMEPNTPKDQARIDRIITMTRNASSDDDAQTLKGSASGTAVSYGGKTMALMTSINCRITNGADSSRYAVCGVKLMPKTPETTKAFNFIDETCRELKETNFGSRFERFVANRIDAFINNIETSIEVIGDAMESGRSGDQYGVLVGAAITAIEGGEATRETIETLVSKMDLNSTIVGEQETSKDDGWDSCWRRIAAVKLDFQDSNASVTVGEAVDWLMSENVEEIVSLAGGVKSKHDGQESNKLDDKLKRDGYKMIEKALGKIGIKYQHNAEHHAGKAFFVEGSGRGIYLARKSETLSSHLKGSTFEDWTQYAKRAALGATPAVSKFAGVPSRAEFIAMD